MPLQPYFLLVLLKGALNDLKFASVNPSPLSTIEMFLLVKHYYQTVPLQLVGQFYVQ